MTVALAGSCCGGGPERGSDAARATPRPAVTDEDVLDAALADLATYVGEDSPVAFRGVVAAPLLVARDAADWPVTEAALLDRHEFKAWQAFPRSEEAALAQAAQNLVSRTTRHAGFGVFRSDNPRIQIFAPESAPKPKYSFLAARPIRMWPPGYSADNRIAIVRMSIPWSIHHADGTFVLANRQGAWSVLVREFIYYP
jgi:hypothetical protein